VTARLQMSCLGRYGRFANALFQYSFLKTYARRHGLAVEAPSWAGNALFGAADPPLGSPLPKIVETSNYAADRSPIVSRRVPLRNVNVEGFFQYHTSYYRPDRDYLRGLFEPVPSVQSRVQPAAERLHGLGQTVVGVHLRRGDYGRGMFYLTPTRWYLAKLAELWPSLPSPVLFVASEDRELVADFADYHPHTKTSLGLDPEPLPLPHYNYRPYERAQHDLHQMDFYPDFYLLSRCDVLLLPNSTFGFFAAMLSPRLKQAFRSHLPTQTFLPLDVWDAVPLDVEHRAEAYRHVPGVCLDANPCWE
jgi:hypothetical protein